MANNKKPKKAYKPKPIYNHTLIGGMAVFDPIKRALLQLKEANQLTTDEEGVALVTTLKGEGLGFAEGLMRVVDMMELYALKHSTKTRMPVALEAIKRLSVGLQSQDYSFDEDLLDNAISEIEINAKALVYLTPQEAAELVRDTRIMNLMHDK